MGSLFGGGKPPPPPPPPPVPTTDQARLRAEQSNALARKRGRAASVLTGPTGVDTPPTSKPTLIGS